MVSRPVASSRGASAAANSPAPPYRSQARSAGRGASSSTTVAARVSAAAGCTCQNASAGRLQSRPSARSCTLAGPDTSTGKARRRASSRRPSTVTSPMRRRHHLEGVQVGPLPAEDRGRLHRRMRDPAPVDRHHLVRAVLEQAGPAGGVHCVLDPGPPAQAVALVGHRRQRPHPDVRAPGRRRPAGQPMRSSCSATTAAFSSRCAAGATCWKSHPPHRSGPAHGHGGSTRSGRRGQDLDRVGPQEAFALVGHHRPHPLTGQAVPDEHHPAVVGPGHAVPAVSDRADAQFEHGAVEGLRRISAQPSFRGLPERPSSVGSAGLIRAVVTVAAGSWYRFRRIGHRYRRRGGRRYHRCPCLCPYLTVRVRLNLRSRP